MKFEVKLEDGQKLKLEKSFLTGKIKARVNSTSLGERSWKAKEPFKVVMKDGSKRSLTFRNHYLDPVPSIWLDGKEILLAAPLSQWQRVVVCIPLALIVLCGFGAVPGVVSVLLAYLNFFIARKEDWPAAARWTAIALVPIVGFVVLMAFKAMIWSGVQSETNRSTYSRSVPTEPSWNKETRPAANTEAGLLNR